MIQQRNVRRLCQDAAPGACLSDSMQSRRYLLPILCGTIYLKYMMHDPLRSWSVGSLIRLPHTASWTMRFAWRAPQRKTMSRHTIDAGKILRTYSSIALQAASLVSIAPPVTMWMKRRMPSLPTMQFLNDSVTWGYNIYKRAS